MGGGVKAKDKVCNCTTEYPIISCRIMDRKREYEVEYMYVHTAHTYTGGTRGGGTTFEEKESKKEWIIRFLWLFGKEKRGKSLLALL